MTNVSISGNRAGILGGGINVLSTGNHPILSNVVLWRNDAGEEGDQMAVALAEITMSHSLIEGGMDGPGVRIESAEVNDEGGNVGGNPVFVQAVAPSLAPSSDGDYRLESVSDATYVGANELVASLTDLHGHSRLVRGRVDIGAYEYQSADISEARAITQNNVGVDFGETQVKVQVIGAVAGEPPLLFVDYVESQADDITFADTVALIPEDFRWVITHTGGAFASATLTVTGISALSGRDQTNEFGLYQRANVGAGEFSKLDASLNDDDLSAEVTTRFRSHRTYCSRSSTCSAGESPFSSTSIGRPDIMPHSSTRELYRADFTVSHSGRRVCGNQAADVGKMKLASIMSVDPTASAATPSPETDCEFTKSLLISNYDDRGRIAAGELPHHDMAGPGFVSKNRRSISPNETTIGPTGEIYVAGGFGSAPNYRDGELPLMVQAEPIFQHCPDVCVDNEKNLYIWQ